MKGWAGPCGAPSSKVREAGEALLHCLGLLLILQAGRERIAFGEEASQLRIATTYCT
jgi:hypothetical protein